MRPTLSPTEVVLGSGVLPMPEPIFYPDGLIKYCCPLGCWWDLYMQTPPNSKLDNFMNEVRMFVSNHYRVSHGVLDEA